MEPSRLGYCSYEDLFQFMQAHEPYESEASEFVASTRLWNGLVGYCYEDGTIDIDSHGTRVKLLLKSPDASKSPIVKRKNDQVPSGYSLNLDSLDVFVHSKWFDYIPNLGGKTKQFAQDFIDYRRTLVEDLEQTG